MRVYRTGYNFNDILKDHDASNETIFREMFIEPVNINDVGLTKRPFLERLGFTYDGDSIIFDIDYKDIYTFPNLNDIRNDIKARLRDDKIDGILK